MTQISLSEDQQSVFDKLEWFLFQDQDCKELRIGGLAGTGKTTLIAYFIHKFFVPLRRQYGSITIGALTGKATERLNSALGAASTQKNAQTLHKILFTVEVLKDYLPFSENFENKGIFEISGFKAIKEDEDDFRSRVVVKENPTLPELIFVDEASMVSKEYYDLLTDPSKGVRKLVFIGDHGQLPPICKPNEEKFNLMEHPHEALTDIHRQLKGNPVIELAHKIRAARNFNEVTKMINDSPLRKISSQFAIKGSIDYVNRDDFTWNDITHIVYKNKTRCEVNKNFLETLEDETDAPIICLKNTELKNGDYLANGSRGILRKRRDYVLENGFTDARFTQVTADFPHLDETCDIKAPTDAWLSEKYSRWFKDKSVVPMDYAFAITCHKAQGSSWKTVVVWTNDMVKYNFDEYKRWMYTAITRAEDSVIFVI